MTRVGIVAGDRPDTRAAAGAADTVVYVSCAESGELHVLRLDAASGMLTTVEVHAAGGVLMPMALSPDGAFLYAARRSAPLEVLSYALDAATGTLTSLGAAPLPDSMCSLATDRSGRWLFAASYGGGIVCVAPIGSNGVAGPAGQILQVGAKAHAIEPDPANRRVLATSLGDGILRSFDLDAASGRLVPTPGVERYAPHPGASPRHLAYARDGRFVYLLGELDAAIDVIAIDASSGTLRTVQTVSAMPADAAGTPWAADLHLTPDGRFLYASERRSSTLVAFRVDAADGTLDPIGSTPAEAEPRGFACTPDGRRLIVAGQRSHHVGVYAIDAASGRLRPTCRVTCGRGPNWVQTRELRRAA